VLSALERLCRIAVEAGEDQQKFTRLVSLEQTPAFDTILGRLSTAPHRSLLSIDVTPFDPAALTRDIKILLRHLVRQPHREPLYDLLFKRFHKGIERRLTFRVRDVLAEARSAGVEFFSPPTFEPDKLVDPILAQSLFILQNCEIGLPDQVLAGGLDCTVQALNTCLSRDSGCKLLAHHDALWAVAPFQPRLTRRDGPVLFQRVVRHLLEFIRANKQNSSGWPQVVTAFFPSRHAYTNCWAIIRRHFRIRRCNVRSWLAGKRPG